jgi:hypothetical protein
MHYATTDCETNRRKGRKETQRAGRPNIKWDKDRGKEPKRDKEEFSWFWNGSGFTGDRVNDVHLTIEEKRKARE